MDWTRAETEIDGCIARLREDQRSWVQLSERAAEVMATCQLRLREDADEIALLAHERDFMAARFPSA